jgi:hypothetical protein
MMKAKVGHQSGTAKWYNADHTLRLTGGLRGLTARIDQGFSKGFL